MEFVLVKQKKVETQKDGVDYRYYYYFESDSAKLTVVSETDLSLTNGLIISQEFADSQTRHK